MRPGATSKETPSSATMPPKRTDTLRTLSSAPAALGSDAARTCACATMDGRLLPVSCCLRRVAAPGPCRTMSDCRTDGPGDIGVSAQAGPVGFLAQVDLWGEK